MAERIDWPALEAIVRQVLADMRAKGRPGFKGSEVERRLLPASMPMYAGLPRRQEWDHYPEMEPRRVLQVLDRLEKAGEIRRARTRAGYRTKKRDYLWPREETR